MKNCSIVRLLDCTVVLIVGLCLAGCDKGPMGKEKGPLFRFATLRILRSELEKTHNEMGEHQRRLSAVSGMMRERLCRQ